MNRANIEIQWLTVQRELDSSSKDWLSCACLYQLFMYPAAAVTVELFLRQPLAGDPVLNGNDHTSLRCWIQAAQAIEIAGLTGTEDLYRREFKNQGVRFSWPSQPMQVHSRESSSP